MPRGSELDVNFQENWDKSNLRAQSSKVEEMFIDTFEWFIWDCSLGSLPNGAVAVGSSEDGFLRCYNKKERLWERQYFRAVYKCLIADMNDDGKNEILVGGCNKTLFVLNEKGEEIWTYPIKKWVLSIAIGDINNDGKTEILFGSRDRKLRALNSKGELIWEQDFGEGHVRYIKIGDVTGDGKNEIIVSTHDGFLYVLKGVTGEEIWTHDFEIEELARIELKKYTVLDIGDITNNGKKEILVGAEDGTFIIFDGDKKELFSHEFDGPIYDICIADNQIIVGAEPKYVKDKAVKGSKSLAVFNYEFKEVFSKTYDAGVYCIKVGDINGDGNKEIVIGTGSSSIIALNNKGDEKWSYYLDNYVRALDVKDIDGDNKAEILVGGKDKSLRLLKATF
ncbi:MAG: FG-GAP-like repeat-containing protein [Candidatus Helarchaeota archaeon]